MTVPTIVLMQIFLTLYSWWLVDIVEITGTHSEKWSLRKFKQSVKLVRWRGAETGRDFTVNRHSFTASVRNDLEVHIDTGQP